MPTIRVAHCRQVFDDSNPVSPLGGPSGSQPPKPPRKGVLATSNRRKWLLAASVVVVLAIAATFYFRGSAQPAYITARLSIAPISNRASRRPATATRW